MAKERVLVVDDEEGVRNSLRNILKDESYAVDVAESGERCLQMVRSVPYHAPHSRIETPARARARRRTHSRTPNSTSAHARCTNRFPT